MPSHTRNNTFVNTIAQAKCLVLSVAAFDPHARQRHNAGSLARRECYAAATSRQPSIPSLSTTPHRQHQPTIPPPQRLTTHSHRHSTMVARGQSTSKVPRRCKDSAPQLPSTSPNLPRHHRPTAIDSYLPIRACHISIPHPSPWSSRACLVWTMSRVD